MLGTSEQPVRIRPKMSPHDSATIEALAASLNDTEKIKSGSPADHLNVASLHSLSSLSGVNPARLADGSNSLNEDLFATRPKYLICLAAFEARCIRQGSVVSSAAVKAAFLPPTGV